MHILRISLYKSCMPVETKKEPIAGPLPILSPLAPQP